MTEVNRREFLVGVAALFAGATWGASEAEAAPSPEFQKQGIELLTRLEANNSFEILRQMDQDLRKRVNSHIGTHPGIPSECVGTIHKNEHWGGLSQMAQIDRVDLHIFKKEGDRRVWVHFKFMQGSKECAFVNVPNVARAQEIPSGPLK